MNSTYVNLSLGPRVSSINSVSAFNLLTKRSSTLQIECARASIRRSWRNIFNYANH